MSMVILAGVDGVLGSLDRQHHYRRHRLGLALRLLVDELGHVPAQTTPCPESPPTNERGLFATVPVPRRQLGQI